MAYTDDKPSIGPGSSTDQIRIVQELLTFAEFPVEITGVWNDETNAAVMALQGKYGVPWTPGVATLATLKQLVILLLHPGNVHQRDQREHRDRRAREGTRR